VSIDSTDTVDAPVGNRAAVEIARRVLESPGDITVLALGRMTNLALALRIAPEIAVALAGVVVMGGAVRVPGNVSPVATANLYEDPESAAVLYDSGVPIVQVGLDVCDRCGFSDSQLHQLSQSEAPAVQLLVRATGFIQQAYRRMGRFAQGEAARYNDVPAVAYAVDAGLMQSTLLPVSIDTASDLTRGQTVVDWHGMTGRAPNVDVCLEVDAARLTEMVVERLINHDWPIH
jgi:inosine-uridine nucleoside N-ribohydrolase